MLYQSDYVSQENSAAHYSRSARATKSVDGETQRPQENSLAQLRMHIFNGRRLDVGRDMGDTRHPSRNARDLCLEVRVGKNT